MFPPTVPSARPNAGPARTRSAAIPRAARQGELIDVTELRPSGPFTVSGEGVEEPVATVVLENLPPHLDRPFDYRVPPAMDAAARVGARVQVRMAGREHSGYVLARGRTTDHDGELAPLKRVVTGLPVLTPEVLELARYVARRHAGTLGDVLRLAIPARHATTETSELEKAIEPRTGRRILAPDATGPWEDLTGGHAYLRHLAAGEGPRAVWTALPGTRESGLLAAIAACLASGRGCLVLAPTGREVEAITAALTAGLGDEPVATLLAEHGPARRYRSFLRVLLGRARVVVGTRAAAFAPVADLGLVAVWDDADDAFAERRAPYPHAREVALARSRLEGAALLLGGYSRSLPAQELLARGEARPVGAERATVRRRTARVAAPTETDLERHGGAAHARIPPVAFDAARRALEQGPVLVQVARGGYVPVVACARCREPARCTYCAGPLGLPSPAGAAAGRMDRDAPRAAAAATCTRCARLAASWQCTRCGADHLRARSVGSARTAAELGRAFPQVPVIASGLRTDFGIIEAVDSAARLVVATPGAEPQTPSGYAAALLLDAGLATSRPELGATAQALRRWFAAAALVRPAEEGGRVLLLGHPAPGPAQALVRWDPGGAAVRDYDERVALRLPPAVACASVEGTPEGVADFLDRLSAAEHAAAGEWEVLGPVPLPPPRGVEAEAGALQQVRAVVRGGRRDARTELTLADALGAVIKARSMRRAPGSVRVRMDPEELW